MKLIKPSERALRLSTKVSVRSMQMNAVLVANSPPAHPGSASQSPDPLSPQIRINVEGMLSMQFLVETGDGNTTFLEYLVRIVSPANLWPTADSNFNPHPDHPCSFSPWKTKSSPQKNCDPSILCAFFLSPSSPRERQSSLYVSNEMTKISLEMMINQLHVV
jgi:hypothetical protein